MFAVYMAVAAVWFLILNRRRPGLLQTIEHDLET
jgi:hypothetical protein